ncbi:hypothetical protein DY052_07460 [Apilactobacillus timberlakei]|uniref:hypothetical protein n=1 Tax=Apilactobacillus timberlakei TaxID=2008380 RepID=UPI00112E5389|nr:hypothetical protein [Apilactobacillus timberlakei]TPR13690.1 hypothetical protein DY052_07460 [Apilactobacillus timberlakei]
MKNMNVFQDAKNELEVNNQNLNAIYENNPINNVKYYILDNLILSKALYCIYIEKKAVFNLLKKSNNGYDQSELDCLDNDDYLADLDKYYDYLVKNTNCISYKNIKFGNLFEPLSSENIKDVFHIYDDAVDCLLNNKTISKDLLNNKDKFDEFIKPLNWQFILSNVYSIFAKKDIIKYCKYSRNLDLNFIINNFMDVVVKELMRDYDLKLYSQDYLLDEV